MNEKKMNKTEKVLNHLREFGSIASLEAIDLYGDTRLSATIYRLRKRGLKINTIDLPFIDRYGVKSHYGKYVLNE